MRRAVDNVLRNAIRYAPVNTKIELNWKVNLLQREVTIDIVDCGPGVPDAMLADIFTPFFRPAPGRETSSGGAAIASWIPGLYGNSARRMVQRCEPLKSLCVRPLPCERERCPRTLPLTWRIVSTIFHKG